MRGSFNSAKCSIKASDIPVSIPYSYEDQKLKEAELARLKRELAKSREEVSFLKKAAAYFAAIESK